MARATPSGQARRRLRSRKAQARGPARDQTGPDDSIGFCVRIARPARSVRVLDPAGGGRRVRPAVCDNKTAPELHHDRAVRRRGFVSLRRACLLYARLVLPEGGGEFCSKHNLGAPVDVIVRLFGVNKFFQLLGFAHLYLLGGLAPPPSLFGLGVGAALVLWGQALNVGIYRDRQGGGL